MKKLEVDLDQLELTIEQLTELRKFMDASFTQDQTEDEVYKSKLLKQPFDITISYLIHTQSMIKKFQMEKENK